MLLLHTIFTSAHLKWMMGELELWDNIVGAKGMIHEERNGVLDEGKVPRGLHRSYMCQGFENEMSEQMREGKLDPIMSLLGCLNLTDI